MGLQLFHCVHCEANKEDNVGKMEFNENQFAKAEHIIQAWIK